MDDAAAQYIENIDPQHRPLFDRLHALIRSHHPEATVSISHGMPTYRVDGRSLIVGVWKHGLSVYGMEVAAATEVIDRRGLRTSKGTSQISDGDAAAMTDDDFSALVEVSLGKQAVK